MGMEEGDKYTGPERRKYPRINVFVSIHSLEEGRPTETTGHAKNLSAGGMCVTIDEDVELNSILSFKINLPTSERPIQVKGRVVWRETIEMGLGVLYDVGIEFVDIDESDRQKISQYVAERLQS